ncbi:MAG: CmcJ/NvfI family oxidoreductase [Cellvibrionaceae bacterium]
MTATAIVNYHVTSDEPQAFHIDANGVKGKILSPILAPKKIEVLDARDSNTEADFWRDSLLFVQSPSSVQNFIDSKSWENNYNQQIVELLKQQLGATEAIVFDHTIRIDDPDSNRKPARNVHSDYSEAGAHERLKDLIGPERVKQWQADHFGFVNLWRPIETPIKTAPLGFIRPQSVDAADWLELSLIYPDRIGQIMGVLPNHNHEWVYLSNMTPDEVAIFNIYDNQGLPSIGHSALDLIENQPTQAIRKSIETRTLIRY